MDGNRRNYDHEDDLEYDHLWRQGKATPPARMAYQHSYPITQRPSLSTTRIGLPAGLRKIPPIIRKSAAQSRAHATPQHMSVARQIGQPSRLIKMDRSRSIIDGESSSRELQYQVPYANEETVTTSEEHNEGEEEDNTGMADHSIKRLEDDLEVDVEGGNEGPSTSMAKMIVRTKALPVFHPSENKALIENHQLKARMSNLIDANYRFREEITQLREQNKEFVKQLRRQEKVIEKQSVELAEAEAQVSDLKRKDKEKDRNYEKELSLRDKRRKSLTVMPCLPNRKVVFSKATKQAQALRLRLLHRYLGELCGPVEGERRLEEKNLIVLRWRKAHAPKPSLEIGRQLLPSEEEEFCNKFRIVGELKKEMKKYLGQKHIDLFGPSERAIAVRKWRMGQREKKRKGEKEDEMVEVGEEVLMEAGNDTDDDELMDDIEVALDEESREGEKTAEEVEEMHVLKEGAS